MSELVDTFYTARNLLYLGAFPQALNNLTTLTHLDSDQELEKQGLQYRAYIGQKKYAQVLNEIPETTTTPLLQAIRQLALSSQGKNQENGVVEKLVANPSNLSNPTFVVVAAQVLSAEGKHEDALRILATHSRNLECVALTAAIFVDIGRADLAAKLMARVRAWSEDAPLAQLAEAWTALHVGGAKYTDAYYIFDELAQASSVSTARLINARAVAKLHLAQYEEAQELLQEALLKDPNDPDTLANSVVCASFMGAPVETRERYVTQLREVDPAHPFIRDLDAKGAEFDTLAAKYNTL
ncbi:hypothetical protein IW140_000643 [Coemansia sp. RSA 1813]|nr:hypothetical protein EV178_003347 [Coemansia sp. RSA 1646]KAJ1774111.1 hypothetical protein LPJ74_000210 [Coemansia sp. RSA 1843]KAJ2092497.1 hypothetical protein IW138_000935 [Coemansia sp. RSA 986]KAJ2216808.1 hypothetical protein EV179_001098 [Coemansia sp. RSA 487]KAJ2572880.1 hypothetical protein IW140_000643 [Coemansia sp. RSA 1813]